MTSGLGPYGAGSTVVSVDLHVDVREALLGLAHGSSHHVVRRAGWDVDLLLPSPKTLANDSHRA